jgi:hypothetical protein
MILPDDVKKFDKLCADLVKLMKKIRETSPEAEIFMEAEGGLMLFDGNSRIDDGEDFNWEAQRGKSHWTPGFGGGAI